MNKRGLYNAVLLGTMAATAGCDDTKAQREADMARERQGVEAQLVSEPMMTDGGAVFTLQCSEPTLHEYAQTGLRTRARTFSAMQGGEITNDTMIATFGSMTVVIVVSLPNRPADALNPANRVAE